jgi:hypothetical protein
MPLAWIIFLLSIAILALNILTKNGVSIFGH